MVGNPLPESLRTRTDLDDVLEDVARARGTSMAKRSEILVKLCRMASELIAQHRDPQRALDWQDPPSADTERILAELRRRYRRPRRG